MPSSIPAFLPAFNTFGRTPENALRTVFEISNFSKILSNLILSGPFWSISIRKTVTDVGSDLDDFDPNAGLYICMSSFRWHLRHLPSIDQAFWHLSPDWTFGLDDEGFKWNINLMFHLWPLALDLQLHFSCLLMMAWAVALVWRIDNVCDFIHETTMLLLLVNLAGRLFSLPQKKTENA